MNSRLILLGITTGLVGFGAPRVNRAGAEVINVQPVVYVTRTATATSASGEDAAVASALNSLSGYAKHLSSETALESAFRAYFSFKAAHPNDVKKPYLYFVDYGLDNRTARGYVFDMEKLELIEGPFVVAHGRGSAIAKDGVPLRFGNSGGSGTTSLGVYTTAETYQLSGHAGGGLYSSIALRLDGQSGRFNDAARARGVVMHGAPYVSASGSGRSLGCPAVDLARARRLIPMIAHGSVVVLYSPNDRTWLAQDPWING
ncbi:MAG TPA: murein L,D-transpeptidase catalytic domain family protein [Longimicrobiales bacterium]|nr:murein L,D-transpeptidase catalytic domain family protein [Longimicrobiales bacterium]